jgi:hypothetical protein
MKLVVKNSGNLDGYLTICMFQSGRIWIPLLVYEHVIDLLTLYAVLKIFDILSLLLSIYISWKLLCLLIIRLSSSSLWHFVILNILCAWHPPFVHLTSTICCSWKWICSHIQRPLNSRWGHVHVNNVYDVTALKGING